MRAERFPSGETQPSRATGGCGESRRERAGDRTARPCFARATVCGCGRSSGSGWRRLMFCSAGSSRPPSHPCLLQAGQWRLGQTRIDPSEVDPAIRYGGASAAASHRLPISVVQAGFRRRHGTDAATAAEY